MATQVKLNRACRQRFTIQVSSGFQARKERCCGHVPHLWPRQSLHGRVPRPRHV